MPDSFVRHPLDVAQVADLLARGTVIAWARGRAEIGPRALGNRSLLAAPFDPASGIGSMRSSNGNRTARSRRCAGRRTSPATSTGPGRARTCCSFSGCAMAGWLRSPTLTVPPASRRSRRTRTRSCMTCSARSPLGRASGCLCNTSLNFAGRGFINRTSDLSSTCVTAASTGSCSARSVRAARGQQWLMVASRVWLCSGLRCRRDVGITGARDRVYADRRRRGELIGWMESSRRWRRTQWPIGGSGRTALGEVLRLLRLEARMSQRDLALRIGFHENAVSSFERGERAPSAQYLTGFVTALRLPPDAAEQFGSCTAGAARAGYPRTSGRRRGTRCPYRGLSAFREPDTRFFTAVMRPSRVSSGSWRPARLSRWSARRVAASPRWCLPESFPGCATLRTGTYCSCARPRPVRRVLGALSAVRLRRVRQPPCPHRPRRPPDGAGARTRRSGVPTLV